MTDSLEPIRVKLARAEGKRDALKADLEAVLPTKAMPVRAEYDAEREQWVYSIIRVPEFPELIEWGVRIGEIVHNLRSSLDLLMWQLVLLRQGRVPDRPHDVYFPIVDDPRDFRKRYAVGLIEQADVKILDRFQPYRRREGPDHWSGPWIHPLMHLKDLSNDDKHRVIPEVVTSDSFTSPGGLPFPPPKLADIAADPAAFLSPGGTFAHLHFVKGRHPLEDGAVILRADSDPPPETRVDMAGTMVPGVALREGRDIFMSLERIQAMVVKIVGEFEGAFE